MASGTLLGKLIVWAIIGVLAIVAIKVALTVFGIALGIGAFLLFTVGPLILIGWLALKGWEYLTRNREAY